MDRLFITKKANPLFSKKECDTGFNEEPFLRKLQSRLMSPPNQATKFSSSWLLALSESREIEGTLDDVCLPQSFPPERLRPFFLSFFT